MEKVLKVVKSKKFIAAAVIAVIIFVIVSRFLSAGKTKYVLAQVKKDNITQLVSASVGIIFGVAPAIRASRLNPINALRYE